MDWKLFWAILGSGIALVFIQGLASWFDGYLTQAQLAARGITGWSFMEHGGMWADVFIISPLVAYFVSNYQLPYFSKWGLVILAVAVVFSLGMGYLYQQGGMVTPEAHTHDGTTTVAGWIHGVYAVAAIWICAMVYIPGLASPPISKADIIGLSMLLIPFFYSGVAKFSERWVFETPAQWQVGASTAIIWAITIARIW